MQETMDSFTSKKKILRFLKKNLEDIQQYMP